MNFYVPTTWRKQFSGRFNKICFLTGVHKIFWLVSGSVLNYYLNWYMRGSVQIFHPQKICSCQKFTGHQKTVCFFSQLNEMYSNGLACLLQCSSIRSYIIDVFYNPRLSICTNENVLCCEVDCHKELFNASHICEYFHHDRRAFGEPLGLLEQVIGSHLTQYQVVHLQKLTAEYLQKTTSILLH